MKQSKNKVMLLGLLLFVAVGLDACGRKKNPYPQQPPPGYGHNDPYGASHCPPPSSPKERSVIGSLGNGAMVRLDLHQGPSGSVYAIGEVHIADPASFYGYTRGTASTNNTYPQYQGSQYGQPGQYGPMQGGFNQFHNPQMGGFHSVVCSDALGVYNRESIYQDLNMVLKGNGITIEFGQASWGGVDTYIRNDRILGNAWVSAPSLQRPEQEWFLMQ